MDVETVGNHFQPPQGENIQARGPAPTMGTAKLEAKGARKMALGGLFFPIFYVIRHHGGFVENDALALGID
ncbi:MAG: hypothetical protein AAGM21_15130, partial [Pseudomonadota bacterium]